jgi:hypothetical protein
MFGCLLKGLIQARNLFFDAHPHEIFSGDSDLLCGVFKSIRSRLG